MYVLNITLMILTTYIVKELFKILISLFLPKQKKAKEYIDLSKYSMGRDKQFPDEWTEEVQNNAKNLLIKVNALLNDLSWEKDCLVSSGFRPNQINTLTPGSAKKSLHQIGKAVDIIDDSNQTLGKLMISRPELLRKYGLFVEDLNSTQGKNTNWVHTDFGDRADRPSRVFKP